LSGDEAGGDVLKLGGINPYREGVKIPDTINIRKLIINDVNECQQINADTHHCIGKDYDV